MRSQTGTPRAEAERIFRANFPAGYLGVSSVTDPISDPSFFDMRTDATTGINTVTVRATAVMPTTFMRLANFTNVTVTSSGEAQRRMVDLSLVLAGAEHCTVLTARARVDPVSDRLHRRPHPVGERRSRTD